MNIVVNSEARIRSIKVSSDTITAYLVDGQGRPPIKIEPLK
ncbi:MAG TPA: hypothetical protein VMO00_11650 [Methylomirabilota bacterium]|nr:hypothetical protein [Methylomirabilota bacterium]